LNIAEGKGSCGLGERKCRIYRAKIVGVKPQKSTLHKRPPFRGGEYNAAVIGSLLALDSYFSHLHLFTINSHAASSVVLPVSVYQGNYEE
jgi:hypothetical protein